MGLADPRSARCGCRGQNEQVAERMEVSAQVFKSYVWRASSESEFTEPVLKAWGRGEMLATWGQWWWTMMEQLGKLGYVSLLSERSGSSGRSRLRSHQRQACDAQSAIPGLVEGQVSRCRRRIRSRRWKSKTGRTADFSLVHGERHTDTPYSEYRILASSGPAMHLLGAHAKAWIVFLC
jgi:hypothetical protein